jgi:acetyl esterase/lipase
MHTTTPAVLVLSLLLFSRSVAQQRVITIWPGLAPGTEQSQNNETLVDGRITNVYQPNLTVFLPARSDSNHPAIVVFPGGGYTHLAIEKEGYAVGRWLNDNGIAAFVLKYRLNAGDALQDARRALSLVRSQAGEFGIDPARIGVMGFSAGGHLAANLAAHYRKDSFMDAVDSVSSKPDFMVLVYGKVGPFVDGVGKETPPAFLVHADDDTRIPVSESIRYYQALHDNGVPAELHVYEKGGHGFALLKDRGAVLSWAQLCIDWMKTRGMVSSGSGGAR